VNFELTLIFKFDTLSCRIALCGQRRFSHNIDN